MQNQASEETVAATLRRINQAWLGGRPADLAPLLDPAIAMVFPGFTGRVQGRDAVVAGFVDFCASAKVHAYRETAHQVDVVGDTAVASFAYTMLYERSGQRYRATGRDLWVFARQDGDWLAVWRTMLDLAEQPA